MGVAVSRCLEKGEIPATEGGRDFLCPLAERGAGRAQGAEQVDSVFRRVLKATA